MDDQDDGLSFDPSRWSRPAGHGRPGPAAHPEPSFDPRSWATPPAAPVSPTPMDASNRQGTAQAIGTGIAILAVGALCAWSARPRTPAPAPVLQPSAPSAQAPAATSRRILTVAGADAIAGSLAAAGIAAGDARRAGAQASGALGPAPGDVRLVFDMDGAPGAQRLAFLEATHADGSGLALTRSPGGFAARRYDAHLTTALRTVRGRLDAQSFYSSAVAAGVQDTLVTDFANAFAFDFDLQREVAPGDRIEAAYDQRVNAAGEAVGVPVLVYASLTTATRARALYRFAGPGDRTPGWYDAAGRSTVRALMRTPIDGARISSPFGMRDHPILGFMKLHKGTDFAAPVGTPIYAAGDATVEFAGLKGPNGNFVKLRHDSGWETLYLHMNRIWPGVVAGARVSQGEQIGEVGTTGRSTGPHLHYEVHVAGKPVDPLGIRTETGKALSGAALAGFRRERELIDAQRRRDAPGSASPPAPAAPAAPQSSPSSR
ncbi:MAG: M23 family metallopeptidase [Janthinobacterium lividum]